MNEKVHANIFTVFTVSTPALNIKMELTLISCGVSSPFMMRYVKRGIAAVQEDISNAKIKLDSQERQRDNHIIEYYRSAKLVSSYEQGQFVRFLVLEMEDDVIEIPLIIKK